MTSQISSSSLTSVAEMARAFGISWRASEVSAA